MDTTAVHWTFLRIRLKDITEFFPGRDDGTTVYGAAIYTEQVEGITMGVTGSITMDSNTKPRSTLLIDGFVNSAGAVEGLQFYKDLDVGTPPGSSNWYG
jgi:multiple sugar transport system substrate-binding protein